ncbi:MULTISPECIES: AAA family ATPase [unclassified Fusobacterium]|uniref:AAA family ATPase n=1 Tax=Fusobacterium sp. TaxID=68766 RepID=UPI0025BA35AB|nr:AAA family ATPase [Fusobacterium sp.]
MLKQKKLGLGVEDFKEIITLDYYYIDKTKFIEELLLDGAKIKLFCRPRRFGKTLNMSTLRYFFDIKNREENRKLFNGLYVENSPLFIEQGKYPIIFITMKGIDSSNWNGAIKNIRDKIFELYNEYDGKINHILTDNENKVFNKFAGKESDEEELKTSLSFLTSLLYKYYNQKVIVLIDEYDSPIISAYENGYYNEAINFFKGFYGNVLKTNEYLHMGILTGIVRVAQAGIFSDLNNIENYTIFNKKYSQYFGLLEDEVKKALQYYDVSYKLEEVKSWYNGYKFGDSEVYNPLSILKFLSTQELGAYWVNTSGNTLIKELLKNSDKTVFDILNNLFDRKETVVYISQSIALGNNLSPDDLWELLLFSGYLTVKEKIDTNTYFVRIPNREIMTFFKNLFVDIIFNGLGTISRLKVALLTKNLDEIISCLENLVLNAMSTYDTDKRYENPYQTLLAGFLHGLEGIYFSIPNFESGDGRPDIVLKPIYKNKPAYILELKRLKDRAVEKELDEALNQIKVNRYDTLLKREGIKDITNIALVFDKKRVYSKIK